MKIELILKPFATYIALIDQGGSYTYSELMEQVEAKQKILNLAFEEPTLVVLSADFTLSGIAWLLALISNNFIVLIQTPQSEQNESLWQAASVGAVINAENDNISKYDKTKYPDVISYLLQQGKAGVLLLSSGTSGEPKLIVHEASRLLSKYEQSKKPYRTLGFLLFDHIAGFDTLMYTLHAGGTLITLPNRNPSVVLQALHKFDVEVLPTSPSFINLLLFEELFNPNYLPKLKIITFGSERINDFTLNRLIARFGQFVRIEQKYGLTELGSLVLKSRPNDPSWIQLDSRFAAWKVENNQLFIKTNSSLLAYIYPDREQFCEGWFNTEDQVLVDGDWLKIIGRSTDIINVGGQKVYPAEVETVIQAMPNVIQVVVSGTPHPLMGQVVVANIQLAELEDESAFRSKLRVFCKDKLLSFKIPVFIKLSALPLMSERFKAPRKG